MSISGNIFGEPTPYQKVIEILKLALKAVIKHDKTPTYTYKNENEKKSALPNGTFPTAGERWLTPREIAEKALKEVTLFEIQRTTNQE